MRKNFNRGSGKRGQKKRFDKSGDKPFRKSEGDTRGDRKSFDRDKKPFRKREGDDSPRERKPFDRDKKRFRKRDGDIKRPFQKREDSADGEKKSFEHKDKRPFRKRESDGNDFRKPYSNEERAAKEERKKSPSYGKPFGSNDYKGRKRKNIGHDDRTGESSGSDNVAGVHPSEKKQFHKDRKPDTGKFSKKLKTGKGEVYSDDGLTRLNKYIAHAGICSRREADDMIRSGVVSVNGVIVTEMGYKVKQHDVVKYNGATLKHENKVYILLNKPKDYITTSDDPQNRRTVLDLVQGACRERIYPVGRLDRNTTGLLLFTNDGDLTTKLTHPKNGIKKVYLVTLDKYITHADLVKIESGIMLEDGMIKPDSVSLIEGKDKNEVGIEIHSGKNRIVRRIFESLGYDVVKLDRVVFAGLTKKNLSRGEHRHLTEKEVNFLKMLG